MHKLTAVLIFAPMLLLAGCANDREFGSSNRNMIRAQSYDPSAPVPASEAPTGLDGPKAEAAMKVYREGGPDSLSSPTPGTISTGP